MQKNRKIIIEKQKQLKGIEENLFSVEEKWIKNKISQETYNRWHSTYNTDIKSLNSTIERLSTDQRRVFKILENKLDLLTDLSYVYNSADTLQKREFVNLVFDRNLYYHNGIYRTPTMLEFLSRNHLKMREKGLLIYEKKEGLLEKDPLSGERGIRTPEPVTVNGFQDRRIRPLCQLSATKVRIFTLLPNFILYIVIIELL